MIVQTLKRSSVEALKRSGERLQWRCFQSSSWSGAEGPQPGAAGTEETPSPPSDGGEGRGEEGRWMPLSSVLSPLLRRGERKKKRAQNLAQKTTLQRFNGLTIQRFNDRTKPCFTYNC